MQYYIIGADGRGYGPVELSTLIEWVHDGRVVPKKTILDAATRRRFLACDIVDLAPAFALADRGASAVSSHGGNPAAISTYLTSPRSADVAQSGELAPIPPTEVFVPSYVHVPGVDTARPRSRIAAGLLGILLGAFGAHRFYLGHNGVGIVMIMLTIVTCGLGAVVTVPWGIVEGILCLTGVMRDADGLPLGE